MARLACVLLGFLSGAAAAATAADVAPELELTEVWSVEGPGRFDASGITVRDGVFYVVTDRHGDTVFRLALEGGVARAEPYLTFDGPKPYPWIGYTDLEGIVAAPDGGFFLAPEWGFAVCHVSGRAGRATAHWVTPDLKAAGAAVGLFATKDAFVEGIAYLGEGHFLIACERGPRGLIEIRGGLEPARVDAQRLERTRYALPAGRTLDFSDLAVWRGRVFVLARNQHLVVELIRGEDGAWCEGDAWSYAAAENAPEHRFTDMTYGQAEGLTIADDTIYVLIDNNNLERQGRPGDRRAWLFAFRNAIPR